jgi:hypothetical protein
MSDRFSKPTLAVYIQRRVNTIQKKYKFTTYVGTAQIGPTAREQFEVFPRDGLAYWLTEVAEQYGEWSALCDLALRYDLVVYPEGTNEDD